MKMFGEIITLMDSLPYEFRSGVDNVIPDGIAEGHIFPVTQPHDRFFKINQLRPIITPLRGWAMLSLTWNDPV